MICKCQVTNAKGTNQSVTATTPKCYTTVWCMHIQLLDGDGVLMYMCLAVFDSGFYGPSQSYHLPACCSRRGNWTSIAGKLCKL